jgi:ElaB/YqjD/DUF883 family membrane-anchored ribosome-binding protein
MKADNEATAQTPTELLNDLRALISEAEKMAADSISEHTADAINALRARYDAAQERLSEFYDDARAKVRAGAQCTDQAIRAHPYQSLAIAAGVGVCVGILLNRCSR